MQTIPSRIMVYDKDMNLSYVADSYEDCAEHLSISVASVKARIYDGLSVRGYFLRYEGKRKKGGRNPVPIIAIFDDEVRHYRCVLDASEDLGISATVIRNRISDGLDCEGIYFDFDIGDSYAS